MITYSRVEGLSQLPVFGAKISWMTVSVAKSSQLQNVQLLSDTFRKQKYHIFILMIIRRIKYLKYSSKLVLRNISEC